MSTFAGLTKGGSLPERVAEAKRGLEPDSVHWNATAGSSEGTESGHQPFEILPLAEGSLRFPRWKRVLDITLVLATFPLWGLLMLIIGLWIKVASRGPVFFSQTRIGFGGRPFIIRKFRSMHPRADTGRHESHFRNIAKRNGVLRKLDEFDDSRIIPGGRFLRALALDELPQIFNVITGEMSLVGPRPCTAKEYPLFEGRQKARFQAPPGLTGFWQVGGKNRTTFNQMVAMDVKYAERMSPLLDLTIILATVPSLLLQAMEYSWRQAPVSDRQDDVALPGHATQPIV